MEIEEVGDVEKEGRDEDDLSENSDYGEEVSWAPGGEEQAADDDQDFDFGEEGPEGFMGNSDRIRGGQWFRKNEDNEDVATVNFSELSRREQLLPLLYLRPLPEQELILQNAFDTEFRVVHDLDKVMDKVLERYINGLAPSTTKEYFIQYARQRGLRI